MSNEVMFQEQLLQAVKEPGSHIIVLNGLADAEDEKANALTDLVTKRLTELADELEAESVKQGVAVTLKTVLQIRGK